MFIGTALGWSNFATMALAIGLAYLFGFTLTSLPLFRAGLDLRAVIPIALAADTVSITIMANKVMLRRGKGHALVHEYH